MSIRRLPVRPDLEQLQRQAKELRRAIHAGDANALTELREHSAEAIDRLPSEVKLSDAQLILARSYRASRSGRPRGDRRRWIRRLYRIVLDRRFPAQLLGELS